MMQPTHQRHILDFEGFIRNTKSCCQFDIYGSCVVIADIEQTSTSSVNQILLITTKIINEYGLDPYNTIFIHHCPENQGIWGREDFNTVPIVWDKGSRSYQMVGVGHWPRLTRGKVEEMIGQLYRYQ